MNAGTYFLGYLIRQRFQATGTGDFVVFGKEARTNLKIALAMTACNFDFEIHCIHLLFCSISQNKEM
jgi:hypothetical protein|nr:MAG TPA: hypothetical protein [Caudoviricetes sp.]